MKDVYIIEKNELMGLSILIAESIVTQSEKFYGFTMNARDTNRALNSDEMLGILAPIIRKTLKDLGNLEK